MKCDIYTKLPMESYQFQFWYAIPVAIWYEYRASVFAVHVYSYSRIGYITRLLEGWLRCKNSNVLRMLFCHNTDIFSVQWTLIFTVYTH